MKRIISKFIISMLLISMASIIVTANSSVIEQAEKASLEIENKKQIIDILEKEFGGMNVYYLERLNNFDYKNWRGDKIEIYEQIVEPANSKMMRDRELEIEYERDISNLEKQNEAEARLAGNTIGFGLAALLLIWFLYLIESKKINFSLFHFFKFTIQMVISKKLLIIDRKL